MNGLGLLGALPVLWREAARMSRRWETYASRSLFSGVLLALVLALVWVTTSVAPGDWTDPANAGTTGTALFAIIVGVQLFIALVLAPLTGARAVFEEIEDRTLDVLVLTRLTAREIYVAKIASRVLSLGTIVLSSAPVLVLVGTMGGVHTWQIVGAVIHGVMLVAVMVVVGAFYGLFTRSAVLCLFASAGYAGMVFLIAPLAYVAVNADPVQAHHLSPLLGAMATDATSFVVVATFAPVLWLAATVGAALFELRTKSADAWKSFGGAPWAASQHFIAMVVVLLLIPVVALPGVLVSWGNITGSFTGIAAKTLYVAARIDVWVFCVAGVYLASWGYLRISTDLVEALDFFVLSPGAARKRPSRLFFDGNPLVWREAGLNKWLGTGLPLLAGWSIAALTFSIFWFVPGAGLLFTLVMTASAMLVSTWMLVTSIGEDRRDRVLDVLLTTRLSGSDILWGKSAGAFTTGGPVLLFLGLPMWAGSYGYLEMFLQSGGARGLWIGGAVWMWSSLLWLVLIAGATVLALRWRDERRIMATLFGVVFFVFVLPGLIGQLFPQIPWIAWPARLLSPAFAPQAPMWAFVLNSFGLLAVAASLTGLASWRLRAWIAAAVGLLAVLAPPSEALAQDQDPTLLLGVVPFAEGAARMGEWTHVDVFIENRGPATRATLRIDEPGEDITVFGHHRVVELPEGARKKVGIPWRPNRRAKKKSLSLVTDDGRAQDLAFDVRWLESEYVVVVIGDDAVGAGTVTDTWGGGVPQRLDLPDPFDLYGNPNADDDRRPVVVLLASPAELPVSESGWAIADAVVWPTFDPTTVNDQQVEALAGWVLGGGHLVVGLAERSPAARGTLLERMMPGDIERIDVTPGADGLLAQWGAKKLGAGPWPRVVLSDRSRVGRPTWTLATFGDGVPAWKIGGFGLGAVTAVAMDLRAAPLWQSTTPERVWRALLWLPRPSPTRSPLDLWQDVMPERWDVGAPAGASPAGWAGDREEAQLLLLTRLGIERSAAMSPVYTQTGGYPGQPIQIAEKMKQAVSTMSGLSPLPITWLLAFSALYLVVIGPLDGLGLRLIGRSPWTWGTFPLWVAVFSTVGLAATWLHKGGEGAAIRVEIVDWYPDEGMARGHSYLGLFSASRGARQATSALPSATLTPLLTGGAMKGAGIEVTEGADVLEWSAESWTLSRLQSRWSARVKGTVRWEVLPDEQGFAVVSELPFVVEDAVLWIGGGLEAQPFDGGWPIGALSPGQRVEIRPGSQRLFPRTLDVSNDFPLLTSPAEVLQFRGEDERPFEAWQGAVTLTGRPDRVIEGLTVTGPTFTEIQHRFIRVRLGAPRSPVAGRAPTWTGWTERSTP